MGSATNRFVCVQKYLTSQLIVVLFESSKASDSRSRFMIFHQIAAAFGIRPEESHSSLNEYSPDEISLLCDAFEDTKVEYSIQWALK